MLLLKTMVWHSTREKTECCIFGKCTLKPDPTWTMDQVMLHVSDSIQYLGVNLTSSKTDVHTHNRINASKKAFYSLKSAGLCSPYNDIDTVSYVYKAAIRPVLLYGLNCINITNKGWQEIDKCQSRILKSALHLHKFCRSSPILKAMKICTVKEVVELHTLDLAKAVFCNNSRARLFTPTY